MTLEVRVCSVEELPPATKTIVRVNAELEVCVFNLDGDLYAIEDRCTHDDGPLCEGDWDAEEGVVICPRHGANFDIRTGKALTLPAYLPVDTFPVKVVDSAVIVEVP